MCRSTGSIRDKTVEKRKPDELSKEATELLDTEASSLIDYTLDLDYKLEHTFCFVF